MMAMVRTKRGACCTEPRYRLAALLPRFISGVDDGLGKINFAIRTHMPRSSFGREHHLEYIRAPAILRTFGADP